MFPFTPHTTLRPDYCSGGSFLTAGASVYSLGTGLRVFAPDSQADWGERFSVLR